MKKSASRILLLLSSVLIPVNILLIMGIMIGGGFLTDTHGYIFWTLVAIFILGFACLVVSWKKLKNPESNLLLSIVTILILLVPLLTTISLIKIDEKNYMQQKAKL